MDWSYGGVSGTDVWSIFTPTDCGDINLLQGCSTKAFDALDVGKALCLHLYENIAESAHVCYITDTAGLRRARIALAVSTADLFRIIQRVNTNVRCALAVVTKTWRLTLAWTGATCEAVVTGSSAVAVTAKITTFTG